MKGIILLTDYFEDVEMLITIDLLRRAKITIDLVSITSSLDLVTQSNVKIKAEYLLSDISLSDYDFLVIPGGKAVSLTHLNSGITKRVVNHFVDREKLVACICAAPAILGQMGLLDGRKFTCFPGYESYAPLGKYQSKTSVVHDGMFITGKAAGSTFKFSAEIIATLISKEVADEVIANIYYK